MWIKVSIKIYINLYQIWKIYVTVEFIIIKKLIYFIINKNKFTIEYFISSYKNMIILFLYLRSVFYCMVWNASP